MTRPTDDQTPPEQISTAKSYTENQDSMPFHGRSAALMLAGTIVIYLPFFWHSVTQPDAALDGKIFGIDFVLMFVALIIIAVAGHIGIALWMKAKDGEIDDTFDERDGAIERRADQWAGYVSHAGLIGSLALVLMDVDRFWIAHALLGTMVLNTIVHFSIKFVLYRRGF